MTTKRIRRAALMVAALLGIAPAALAVNCEGTLTGTIRGNVVVAKGAMCTLGGAHGGASVSGNVIVEQGATLVVAARQYPTLIAGNVTALRCASALLDGAVTVGGSVEIARCSGRSGFNGPGAKIAGSFSCHDNAGACEAVLGEVGGDVKVQRNASAAANVSLTEIGGSLQCDGNAPAPAAAWGGNWVAGATHGQCASGFVWAATPPNCAALAAELAKVPYVVSTPMTNDNITYPAVASTQVAPAGSNAGYCNVQLTYSAIGSPGSSAPLQSPAYGYGANENQAIRIGVGLPLSAADGGSGGAQGAWNGRLQHLGGGGLVGSVGSTLAAVNTGYVGSSTDSGHTSAQNGAAAGGGNFGVTGTYTPPNNFVPTSPNNTLDVGKIDDYIIEGIHQQTQMAKLLARMYYGQKWSHNYWNGCSTGGRQGLTLAKNYGDEFDGFLVGAPAIWHNRFRLSDAWAFLVNQDDLVLAGKPGLTSTLWNATTAVVVAACQTDNSFAASGATGYLGDPRACAASAGLNICGAPNAHATNCLTPDQAAAADRIWAGPHNAAGRRIWYPSSKGVTGGVINFNAPQGSYTQVMSWDHADTAIDPRRLHSSPAAVALYNPTSGIAYETEALLGSTRGVTAGAGALSVNDLVDSVVPSFGRNEVDLDLAKQRGAKVIMWHGTADPLIRTSDSIDYYRLVATHYGNGEADFAGLQPWFRYYSAPGVGHCGGGVGPQPNSLFGRLVAWVESGTAPDVVPTTGGANASITPPLCPWPSAAVYVGNGAPTNDPANYRCEGDLDANPVALCQMLRTPTGHETDRGLNYQESGISRRVCPLLNGGVPQ